ncbi:DUF4192 domain-containing protein [Nocardioides speluncae]|uniref:DUF4192 domain-containing protein n=1 Tax=Nocardioides speluncae TaxID=2670337 RepID=UPI0012B16997|nr:DUF4192 domain-containing protein [Nocardioides speluncae]
MNSPQTIRATTPEDVIAAAPVALGFHPTESVVMMSVGRGGVHCRTDLPTEEPAFAEVADDLAGAAVRNDCERAVFVIFSERADDAARQAERLADAFSATSVEVIAMIRADGERWFALAADAPPELVTEGVPYDVGAHPITTAAVYDGAVTHASREELAATIDPDPDAVRAVTAAVERASHRRFLAQPAAAARWVERTVRAAVREGTILDVDDAARLLVSLTDLRVRDVAWADMSAGSAAAHVAFWTDLVRRSPPELLPAPATMLAFASWLSGHGALAWCALDRCSAVDPAYTLAELLADLLRHAARPDGWTGIPRELLTLLDSA